MITPDQLQQIIPKAKKANIDKYAPLLPELFEKYDLKTRLRQAAFIAQIAHESGHLNYVREIASGEAYEGRKDLGNTQVGDGKKFKGRGLIQITGRTNYRALSKYLFGDERLLETPELLEQPRYALESALWFWNSRNLSPLADLGDFKKITKKINGGYNGLAEREKYYKKALEIIS